MTRDSDCSSYSDEDSDEESEYLPSPSINSSQSDNIDDTRYFLWYVFIKFIPLILDLQFLLIFQATL